MLKRERQKKLLNLIRAKRIGTQDDLRAHLEHAGVTATQSSLSRDLEELGVVKHHGAYALPQANGNSARGLLSLDFAGDALVIARCLPGRASARARLAEVHDERIVMAGEAVSPDAFSTAHGAAQTGFAAAKTVLARLAP